MNIKKSLWYLLYLLLPLVTAYTQTNISVANAPRIKDFHSKDKEAAQIYKQYCADVEQSYKDAAKHTPPFVTFYSYKATEKDTIFTIAASCSIPYDTIATLNSIPSSTTPLANKVLLLPTAAGIFVTKTPNNSLEILIQKNYLKVLEDKNKLWYTINGKVFCFLENERFDATERAFFLDTSLRMPLDNYWLSSSYGMRISPISGKWKMHKGIDMAAPEGTSVYACKSGTALECGYNDPIFGNYIILKHDNAMTSVYAHLSKILLQQGDYVSTGREIGKVGMTGAATGPHLHFEIRINNVSTNPQSLLKSR